MYPIVDTERKFLIFLISPILKKSPNFWMEKKILNREKDKYEVERGTIPRNKGHIYKVFVTLRLRKSR